MTSEVTHSSRLPLYYTFGNHMHWVDMEWLWGYNVMPDSTRDMLHFCAETGAKGNINFDGIGYEKLAVEAPDALAALREAIARGQIEVVGSSYGQPYGLFHGGESNVRQRIYGVRTAMRVLHNRPRTFWEEEFDFFPQLPQMLKGVGFEYASLFFQWTWHTPEIPRENLPALWWEGIDGTRLLAAPRNALNLHQWPEDFAGLLDSPLLREMPIAGIVQWLELMPSPDWMCRSELLLPQLRKLIDDPRFDLRFVTLSEYLDLARKHAEVRHYTLDDVFHGMSLGKNGDLFRRLSRRSEENAQTAESLTAMMGLFGRPYPQWDVYPTWELEEAWRELLSAQHHDNDECEGLCGYVGKYSYERSLSLTEGIQTRSMQLLADRVSGEDGRTIAYNPLGWTRKSAITEAASGETRLIDLPAMGYEVVNARGETLPPTEIENSAESVTLKRGALTVSVDKVRGVIRQITSADFPEGLLREDKPLGTLQMTRNGSTDTFEASVIQINGDQIVVTRTGHHGAEVTLTIQLAAELDAVDVHYTAEHLPRPDSRMHAALQTSLAVNLLDAQMIHDHPYGVSEIEAQGKQYLRKYPTGEWMTSPQVFEDVVNPFTAYSFLDLTDDTRGLLYLHDGSQAFFRAPSDPLTVSNILSMYDAWDENYFVDRLDTHFRLIPHGKMDHATRWKLAQEFRRPALAATSKQASGDLPATFSPISCDAPNVAVTAFYRETEPSARETENYAGRGMGFPYVIRLVEFNGESTRVTVRLPGTVATAYKTNLMGEIEVALPVKPAESAGDYSEVTVEMRAREIATIYADIEMGRKMPRNLDAYRFVWATVHRVDEQ